MRSSGIGRDGNYLFVGLGYRGMVFSNPSIPRPGLVLGRYPECREPEPSKLDGFLARASSLVCMRWASRASHLDRVVSDIDHAGALLVQLTTSELMAVLDELRTQLVRKGWDDLLTIKVFALVREMATRTLGMRHFNSQLLGGWVMFHDHLAEMQTGEGKTLSATLPAATAALAGVPVHVITTNDYLAARDAQALRPLYEALGLTVGVVVEGMDFETRCSAYDCDITYTTNKQVCFDYLRDRVERKMTNGRLKSGIDRLSGNESKIRKLMLRGLCFAIIDEADSVLIDEARTPLVLSRNAESDELQARQYQQALALAGELAEGVDYDLREDKRQVFLTPNGSIHLAHKVAHLGSPWDSVRRRDELVLQALSALRLFLRDRDYVVHDDQIQIVDSNTGRVMADRSWERGLHQMVETKEQCTLSDATETLARISYQRFFRRYLKLAGMTGTGSEVSRELRAVYNLNVTRIEPHRKCQRVTFPERLFLKAEDVHTAVVDSVREQIALGRPVLIGTRSVQSSKEYAKRLINEGITVQVLNAAQDHDEARIIAEAGEAGRVTVATNMAGRGTDIHLGPGVEKVGGLHVIATERNDSARVDRQLVGRCARQGEPGSYQCFASLDDEIPKQGYRTSTLNIAASFLRHDERRLPKWPGRKLIDLAQRRMERRHEQARRQVEREDKRLNTALSFSGVAE